MDYENIIWELGTHIGNSIGQYLNEDAKRPVAVYAGRFQPFHKGHYSVYQALVKKFGKDNVYIGTSNVTDNEKSPFNFSEKHGLITKLFGVPADKVVQVKNPYAPTEILDKYPEDTPFVTAVSSKDAERLGSKGKYFKKWDGNPQGGYKDSGYFIVAPEFKMDVDGGNISGTQVRKVLGDPNTPLEKKKEMFQKLYGKFDPQAFKLITGKLSKSTPTPEKKPAQKIAKQHPDVIYNPTTKRKIKFKTALGYDRTHPAHRAAMAALRGEGVLLEGGAAGHLAHPYEDQDLTFGELKDMIKKGLSKGLDKDAPVTEKTDGQNIMFTFKDGQLRFARNNGHVKNKGQTALTADQLAAKFAGRGDVEKAFTSASDDILAAIQRLPPEYLESMFNGGSNFMNVEILYPATKNIIPYNNAILQFHGTVEFDENGKQVGRDTTAGKVLSSAVRDVNADKQKTFKLRGPNIVSFSDYDEKVFQKRLDSYEHALEAIQSRHDLSDKNTLGDYTKSWWTKFIDTTSKAMGIPITPQEKEGLIRRWGQDDKTFGKKNLSDVALQFFNAIEPKAAELNKKKDASVEKILLHAGSAIIKRVVDGIAANNPAGGLEIQKKVNAMIDQVQKSNDPELQKKLQTQLKRLDAAGGLDSIVPIEGLVFMYGGKPYKFTGTFAPVNQILGLRGFEGKRDEPASEPEKKTAPEPKEQPKKHSKLTGNEKVHNPKTGRKILVKTALGYEKSHPAHKAAERMVKSGIR